MVSLLVSFTLTPMMSARLLKAAPGPAEGSAGAAEEAAASRRGFYAWIDRGYAWSLGLAMGHRTAVAIVTVLVIAATVPALRARAPGVHPDRRGRGRVRRPGHRPPERERDRMDEVMQRVAKEIAGTLRGAPRARLGGRRLPRPGQPGHGLRAPGPARRAHHHVRPRLARPRVRRSPRGLPGQLEPARRDAGGPAPAGPHSRPAHLGAQRALVQYRRRQLRHRLRHPRPRPRRARPYGETLRERARALGGIADPDTTLKLDKPELRVEIDRARAADLGVDTEQVAEALRLMVGGDQEVSRFLDPDRERRLRRAAPARGGRPPRSGHDRAPLRAAPERGRARAAGQRREDRARGGGLPHRPLGPAAREPAPRLDPARLRPGRPDPGAAEPRWPR